MKLFIVAMAGPGQINALLAVTQEMIKRGHDVHFASGTCAGRRFEALKGTLQDPKFLHFHDLGSFSGIDDYIPAARERLAHGFRHRSEDFISFLIASRDLLCGVPEERVAHAYQVRDLVEMVDPDMIIVDQAAGASSQGVQMTGRPFIISAPASSGCVATGNPLTEPLPMTGTDWTGSWSDVFANFKFLSKMIYWALSHEMASQNRKIRREVLGLKPFDFVTDSFAQPPGGTDQVCASISFNVGGLDFFQKSSFPRNAFFVGACLPEKTTSTDVNVGLRDSLTGWLDEAHSRDEDIIYINFGTMFAWTAEEYQEMISALEQVHELRPSFRALFKVPDQGENDKLPPASALPSFIRREVWLPSVDAVYNHPATKVIVHHGGGNTFNEAVYHGIPQLVCPQWSDTYDYAAIAKGFGLGLRPDSSPFIRADDIRPKLLEMLEENAKFKKNAVLWQLRSRHSGGRRFAADIIEAQMHLHSRRSNERVQI